MIFSDCQIKAKVNYLCKVRLVTSVTEGSRFVKIETTNPTQSATFTYRAPSQLDFSELSSKREGHFSLRCFLKLHDRYVRHCW